MIRQLEDIVLENAGQEVDWVRQSLDQLRTDAQERDLHIFLGMAPRRLGKADLVVSSKHAAAIDAEYPGWRLDHWSIDGTARVLGLVRFNRTRSFAELFKDLRRTADAAEMVALFRGLPFYPEPETLDFEVGEALRSNLLPVFEAVAQNNPFPQEHFDEHRWNHMILKALFVGAQLGPVLGLEERMNRDLAEMMLDFADERWAAHRPVPPDLWQAVRPFRDDPELGARIAAALSEGRLKDEVPA